MRKRSAWRRRPGRVEAGDEFSPRLHHFATSVADLDTTVAWYVQTLGFADEFRYALPEMGLRAAFVSLEDFRLEVFEQTDSVAPPADELRFDRYLGVRGSSTSRWPWRTLTPPAPNSNLAA